MLVIEQTSFSETVKLPSLTELKLDKEDFNFLVCKEVVKIFVSSSDKLTTDKLKWLSTIQGLKQIKFGHFYPEYANHLPSSVRNLCFQNMLPIKIEDGEEFKVKLPHLITVGGCLSLTEVELLKLREIPEDVVGKFNKQMTARPRQISVTERNIEVLNKHPELFEKIQSISILSPTFDFDWLPKKIDKICVSTLEIESYKISRFQAK